SSQAGLRCLVDGKGRQLPQGHDRERALLAGSALGAFPGVVRRRRPSADAKRDQHGVKPPGSLLVVILIIVFIVVVGLTGGVVRTNPEERYRHPGEPDPPPAQRRRRRLSRHDSWLHTAKSRDSRRATRDQC